MELDQNKDRYILTNKEKRAFGVLNIISKKTLNIYR